MDNQNTQVVSSFEVGESSVPFRSAFFPESSGEEFELQKQFILLELQHLIESYNEVSSQLHHTICYIDTLKKENLLLESEKLKLLSADCDQDGSSPSSSTIIPSLELQRSKEAITEQNIPNPLPSNLPKSISIRSAGFLASRNHPIPLNLPSASPLQNDGVVKVDAYSQGMTKTELCNKWGEMGACPYAEHCRFAHGLEELRPVIRHPRYKTQLCRMLANDGGCPYGHRCHFRHAAISTTFND